MGRRPTVQVDGLKRLRKELKRAGVDLADLREPNLEAAQTVASAAGPRTPRRSGRLASTVRPGANRTAGVIRAGNARVPYAGVIHWGWPARNIKAQPWLSDTATSTEEQWVPHYMAALDRVLSHIAGGP
jgi:hypothetical protein